SPLGRASEPAAHAGNESVHAAVDGGGGHGATIAFALLALAAAAAGYQAWRRRAVGQPKQAIQVLGSCFLGGKVKVVLLGVGRRRHPPPRPPAAAPARGRRPERRPHRGRRVVARADGRDAPERGGRTMKTPAVAAVAVAAFALVPSAAWAEGAPAAGGVAAMA